jgi:hypothetical protein
VTGDLQQHRIISNWWESERETRKRSEWSGEHSQPIPYHMELYSESTGVALRRELSTAPSSTATSEAARRIRSQAARSPLLAVTDGTDGRNRDNK